MKRVIACLLQAGLIVTSLAAIVMAVRIILGETVGIGRWYWGGAVAAFLGPVAFALTVYLLKAAPTRTPAEPEA